MPRYAFALGSASSRLERMSTPRPLLVRHGAIHGPDYMLLLAFAGWLIFGLIMLTSASAPAGYQKFHDSYFFIKRQLLFGLLPGIPLFLIFSKISYQRWLAWATPLFILSLVLLLLVFVPGIGTTFNTVGGRWLKLGPYSMHPAEFAKFAYILFLSAYIARLGERILDFQRGLLPALILGFLPIGLILLEPDVGTATIFFIVFFGLLFIARANGWHLFALAATGVVGFAILVIMAPYRTARLTTFLHPELDPKGIGYQINQGFMAIGSGGLIGLGLGHSLQKFQYLPEVQADSIFAIIAEEMGFFSVVALVILLLFISRRAFTIARAAPDLAGQLLVAGVMLWFTVQSFFNIGAVVGLLPLTGVPLPFVSHGGTALLVSLAGVGIISNISKYAAAHK